MKLAIISTIPNTNLSELGDIGMCLAQLTLKHKDYYNFFKEYKKSLILDNGEYENEQIEPSELIELAIDLKPTYIVLPDKFKDGYKTMERVQTFLKDYRHLLNENGIKTIGAIHYKKGEDITKILKYYDEEPNIHLIGIGLDCLEDFEIDIKKNVWYNHLKKYLDEGFLFKTLRRNSFILEYRRLLNKDIHLLGCHNPFEVHIFRKYCNVISCDTSSAIMLGMKKTLINNVHGIKGKPFQHLNFHKKLEEEEVKFAEDNIRLIKELNNERVSMDPSR